MRVWVLGSGSSGNAAVVEAGGTRLLVDAGMGPRTAAARMRMLGGDLFPGGVSAIVVTHEHNDHAAHLEGLARQLRCPVLLHRGIKAPRVRARFDVHTYEPGAPFAVGALTVDALAVPHDAPQVALRVTSADRAFAIVTDLGHVPRGLAPFLGACDAALVEANHCPELLAFGPYPPRLRERVGGHLGHLANAQTAELAGNLLGSRLVRLYLGHISRANNTPERALGEVRRRSGNLDVRVVPNGAPQLLDVPLGRRVATQLAFGFR